jgi:galactarate dehydratase
LEENKRPIYIKVSKKDNVAITVDVVAKGTIVVDGVVAHQEIPQGHKIALSDIPKDG